MIREFVDRFMDKRPEIREQLRKFGKNGWGGIEYKDIVRVVVENVAGSHSYPPPPDPDRIHEIDDGYCQGMLLYVIAENDYQPDKYWYVTVGYGSCSGCDTLMRATECNEDDEQVLDDLMTLALHIVQGMKRLDDDQMKENMCSCNRSRDYDALLERHERLENVAKSLCSLSSNLLESIADIAETDNNQYRAFSALGTITAAGHVIGDAKEKMRELGVCVDD